MKYLIFVFSWLCLWASMATLYFMKDEIFIVFFLTSMALVIISAFDMSQQENNDEN